MQDKFKLIISYLANELNLDDTDIFEIIILGTPKEIEVQTCYNPGQNLPSNYIINSNELKQSINRIINYLYDDELKHFNECTNKQNHILNDLNILKLLI